VRSTVVQWLYIFVETLKGYTSRPGESQEFRSFVPQGGDFQLSFDHEASLLMVGIDGFTELDDYSGVA
jgi:hypothetical protein